MSYFDEQKPTDYQVQWVATMLDGFGGHMSATAVMFRAAASWLRDCGDEGGADRIEAFTSAVIPSDDQNEAVAKMLNRVGGTTVMFRAAAEWMRSRGDEANATLIEAFTKEFAVYEESTL